MTKKRFLHLCKTHNPKWHPRLVMQSENYERHIAMVGLWDNGIRRHIIYKPSGQTWNSGWESVQKKLETNMTVFERWLNEFRRCNQLATPHQPPGNHPGGFLSPGDQTDAEVQRVPD